MKVSIHCEVASTETVENAAGIAAIGCSAQM